MGLNLAQTFCDSSSSSSSTPNICSIENLNKCSRVPCCFRNSILNDHTYSILKRICNKIIKNFNRQQCLETYTVFDGGNSISSRQSERQYKEDGRNISNDFKPYGGENKKKNDPTFRYERIDSKVIATNRNKNKRHTGDGGEYSSNNIISENSKGKLSKKLQNDSNDYYNENAKRGSRKLKKIKVHAGDDKDDDILLLGKSRNKGSQSRKPRSKKDTPNNDQLFDRSNKRIEEKDGKTIGDIRKTEKTTEPKFKYRNSTKDLRNSKATFKNEERKGILQDNVRPSRTNNYKQGDEKNITEKKNAGYVEASLQKNSDMTPIATSQTKRSDKNVEENGPSKTKDYKQRDEKNITEKKNAGYVEGSLQKNAETKTLTTSQTKRNDKNIEENRPPDEKNITEKKNAGYVEASVQNNADTKNLTTSKTKRNDRNIEENRPSKAKDYTQRDEKNITEKKNAGYVEASLQKNADTKTLTTSKTKRNDQNIEKIAKTSIKKERYKNDISNNKVASRFSTPFNTKELNENNLNNVATLRLTRDMKRDENNRNLKKNGKEESGYNDSRLIKLSGRKERHEEASAFSVKRVAHKRQSVLRRSKGSKFIQYQRRSRSIQRPTRCDEVRTCDILRVHMEQRDLTRCFLCHCNVCGTCVPCLPRC